MGTHIQTWVKTLPSRGTAYAGGKNKCLHLLPHVPVPLAALGTLLPTWSFLPGGKRLASVYNGAIPSKCHHWVGIPNVDRITHTRL